MVWSIKTCIFNRHALYTAKPQCCRINVESLKKIAWFFICVAETFREGISKLTIATKSELSMWGVMKNGPIQMHVIFFC